MVGHLISRFQPGVELLRSRQVGLAVEAWTEVCGATDAFLARWGRAARLQLDSPREHDARKRSLRALGRYDLANRLAALRDDLEGTMIGGGGADARTGRRILESASEYVRDIAAEPGAHHSASELTLA